MEKESLKSRVRKVRKTQKTVKKIYGYRKGIVKAAASLRTLVRYMAGGRKGQK